jgi:hypothetical protein
MPNKGVNVGNNPNSFRKQMKLSKSGLQLVIFCFAIALKAFLGLAGYPKMLRL